MKPASPGGSRRLGSRRVLITSPDEKLRYRMNNTWRRRRHILITVATFRGGGAVPAAQSGSTAAPSLQRGEVGTAAPSLQHREVGTAAPSLQGQ